MSPASYLTAPPRDAASIVAPQGPRHTVVTMAAMPLLDWFSLLFLVLAFAGSITLAVVRALRTWRAFKGLSEAARAAAERVTRSAADAERHAVALADNGERLNVAALRLNESLAQLGVLRAAATNARAMLDVRTLLPRK